MSHLEKLDAYFTENRDKHLAELNEFLRIPSISALSEHKEDMRTAANWLADALKKLNIENVAVEETAGHPVVYGEWLHAKDKPTVLFYGHYDVQPVDPLNLWDSPHSSQKSVTINYLRAALQMIKDKFSCI